MIYTASAFCCDKNKDCIIKEQCHDGVCGNCTITMYNIDSTFNHTANLTAVTNHTYKYNLSEANITQDYGIYPYTINCTTSDTCLGDCNLEYKFDCEEKQMGVLSMIIVIPLFISVLFFMLSIYLDKKKHPAMKKFFMLLSFVGVFQAYHFGTLSVIKFYNFPELQDAIGTGMLSFGTIFWVVLVYFIIDFIVAIFKLMAGKKHKTGEYLDGDLG